MVGVRAHDMHRGSKAAAGLNIVEAWQSAHEVAVRAEPAQAEPPDRWMCVRDDSVLDANHNSAAPRSRAISCSQPANEQAA